MKQALELILQYKSPAVLQEILYHRDEHDLETLISKLEEERDLKPGALYPKYTAAITMLKKCLENCRVENSLQRLIRANEEYRNY